MKKPNETIVRDMPKEVWIHETMDYVETVNTKEYGLHKYHNTQELIVMLESKKRSNVGKKWSQLEYRNNKRHNDLLDTIIKELSDDK